MKKEKFVLLIIPLIFSLAFISAVENQNQKIDTKDIKILNPFDKIWKAISDLQNKVTNLFNITTNLQKQIKNISLIPGPQGIPGINGTNGKEGINGIDGKEGLPGRDGVNGVNGINGTDGNDGVVGPPGIQGIQGEQGVQGILGEKGDKGDQGIQGEQGIQGLSGKDGAIGSQGIPGPTKNLTTMYTSSNSGGNYIIACCPSGWVRTGCNQNTIPSPLNYPELGVIPTDNECCKVLNNGMVGNIYAICLKYSD